MVTYNIVCKTVTIKRKEEKYGLNATNLCIGLSTYTFEKFEDKKVGIA